MPNQEFEGETIPVSGAVESKRLFTKAEVAKANTTKKCLLIIRDRVYSVADFISKHPGGEIIMTYAGEDATDVFAAFHAVSTYKMLDEFLVGELSQEDKGKAPDFVEEIRKLKIVFKNRGYFKSSKLYYSFKILFNFSMLCVSAYLAAVSTSGWGVALAGFILALFWQQSGWLAHDFLHHQVFENRSINNFVGYVVGNIWQGFSVDWWKQKHNTHHAVPNIHGADPDVDTMPFLAWSEHALEGFHDPAAKNTLPKFLIDHQMFFYTPLLAFARFSWALQSLLWVQGRPNIKNYHVELATLTLHWLGYAYIVASCQSISLALIFIAVSQLGCGILLASVFSLNHNGMPILTKEEAKSVDFFTRQIVTGRDVIPTVFSCWFTGGLNYQIEHHLFPQLPRHNFHKVSGLTQDLCKRYGVTYHQTGFVAGTVEIFRRLNTIGSASQKL